MMKRTLTLALLLAAAIACGGQRTQPVDPNTDPTDPGTDPSGRTAPAATTEPTSPATAAQILEPARPPPPALAGDDKLDERWRPLFREWLITAKDQAAYVAVVDTMVVANGASVVLRRHVEAGGACREGPSTLSIIQDEGAAPTFEVVDFGDDCCAGTECKRTEQSWNLRFLGALAAKDAKVLASLVPAKGKLVWNATWASEDGKGGKKSQRLSRKDVAAGKLADAPGCGFINTTPACDPVDAKGKGFTCTCHGGGYHVTYHWQKEGAGFVLVRIDEDSH